MLSRWLSMALVKKTALFQKLLNKLIFSGYYFFESGPIVTKSIFGNISSIRKIKKGYFFKILKI